MHKCPTPQPAAHGKTHFACGPHQKAHSACGRSRRVHLSVRVRAQNALFRRVRFSSPAQTWSHLTQRRILRRRSHVKAQSATTTSRKSALWGLTLTEKRALRRRRHRDVTERRTLDGRRHGKAHFACETRPQGAFCMRAVVAPRGRFRRSVYTPAYPRPLSRPGGSTGPTTSRTHGPRDAKVPGPEAHATGAVTQPSTHTNSRSLILFAHLPVLAPLDASEWRTDRKRPRNSSVALQMSGSPGRIRTCDTLINSQLRYHCATGECCHAPMHGHLLYQNSDRMQGHSSAPYKRAAHIHLRCP